MTEKFEKPEWYKKSQIEDYKKMNERLAKIDAELADMLKPRFPSEPTKAQQNRKLLINATAAVILSTLSTLAFLMGKCN